MLCCVEHVCCVEQDFMQCRQRLMDEIEQERRLTTVHQQVACNTDSDHSSGAPMSSSSKKYEERK